MKNFLTQSYVDHFLQAEIIRKLAVAEGAVRFSDLKEDGIENSLFMYHANKLIDRGVIAKKDGGFTLTVKGARWANFADLDDMTRVLPRPLVQLIVCSDMNELLIATRKGQFKALLNSAMLPGGLHKYGMPAEAVAASQVKRFFGDVQTQPTFLTVAEVIHTSDDEFIHHVISHMFQVKLDHHNMPQPKELFDYHWVPMAQVTTSNPLFAGSEFIPQFIAKLPHLQPHEVFHLAGR